jgi:hypothetical protein
MGIFGPTDTFNPNPKQARYLASDADILLMGGGAGSGKSLVALLGLLGLNSGITVGGQYYSRYQLRDYNGLIYRKHLKDMQDLIKESKKIYPCFDPGAKYNNADNYWTFTSGARIYMSYFERFDQCEHQIQGQQFQTIVAEEVGQHEDDSIFRYCLSRLRSAIGLRCYMRATSNPGRFPWLREFFRIDDVGNSTKFDLPLELDDGTKIIKRVEYIQAKLSDNKYLGNDYRAQLMLLSKEDRLALLDGRWDSYFSIAGQVYEHELKDMHLEHRVCALRHDPTQPVTTFWDIGMSDDSVVLFVQFVGKEIHIIDQLEANNVGYRDHYIPIIKRYEQDKGYRYEAHYLPHDSAKRDPYTTDTLFSSISKDLPHCKQCKQIDKIETGIQMAKQMFPNVWIDKDLVLVDHLIHYRRKWDAMRQVYLEAIHDKHSHAADAFRYIAQREKPATNWAAYQPAVTNYGY